MKRRALWFAVALAAAIPSARADEPAPDAGDAAADEPAAAIVDGEVIVIVGRIPRAAGEGAQLVHVVDRDAIELTAAEDLTDVLKKNASVDVIQYPGGLSGIGMRGFRPEFSGITKHSLLLVDGRPAGVTNLATVPLTSIEQVEVLHGPASALYGAQAVGGVVNVVRRRSAGPIRGSASAGYGSAHSWQADVYGGGNASEAIDFDVAGSVDLRAADMRLGDGTTRPHTAYGSYAGRARARVAAGDHWTVELDGDASIGRDIESPGDVLSGDARYAHKDLDGGGVALTSVGHYGRHELSVVGFGMLERARHTDVPDGAPAHRSRDGVLTWLGGQLRYTGRLGAHRVAGGLDVERIDATTRSYDEQGMREAPYGPDNRRTTVGVYMQGHSELLDGLLLATYGLRADRIALATLETEYKTDFTPGTADFVTVNPSVGLSGHWRGLRPHASAGTAFVPPEAAQMAGYAEREVEGVVMVTRGNPALDPERAWSVDAGVGYQLPAWGLDADVTAFVTRVADKIDRRQLSDIEMTYANVGTGRIEGWQGELGVDVGRILGWGHHVRPFAAWSHIVRADEGEGDERADIHNVARWNVRYGLELGGPRWSARAVARYRGAMKDTDWHAAGYPEITYPTWTVIDAVGRAGITDTQYVQLEARNVTDRYYYEKHGFPLMGRSFFVRYGVRL